VPASHCPWNRFDAPARNPGRAHSESVVPDLKTSPTIRISRPACTFESAAEPAPGAVLWSLMATQPDMPRHDSNALHRLGVEPYPVMPHPLGRAARRAADVAPQWKEGGDRTPSSVGGRTQKQQRDVPASVGCGFLSHGLGLSTPSSVPVTAEGEPPLTAAVAAGAQTGRIRLSIATRCAGCNAMCHLRQPKRHPRVNFVCLRCALPRLQQNRSSGKSNRRTAEAANRETANPASC
jgi:hypothetical protein